MSSEPVQAEAAGSETTPPFLPVRMLNEFAYCARLGYLEWVQGEFTDNDDAVEGRYHHRNVDRTRLRSRRNEDGDGKIQKIHERSVWLGSETLGLSAKIDLVEGEGRRVMPIDYKRGKRPHVPRGAYEPVLVQLCAQGLLLIDSPKCPRCSLVGICLPDEVRYLTGTDGTRNPPRPLVPARDDALPLHVQHPGARVRKDGEVLQIVADDEVIGEARLAKTSQVVLFGSAHVTTPVVQELCQRAVPLCYLSSGGWFYGITHGMSHKNVELRRRQYTAASDPAKCLTLARRFVQAKIVNCRTLLRRNHPSPADDLLDDLKGDIASQPDSHERPTGWAPQHLHSAESAFPGRVATNDDGRSAVGMRLTLVRGPRSTASLVAGSTRPAEPTTFVGGE